GGEGRGSRTFGPGLHDWTPAAGRATDASAAERRPEGRPQGPTGRGPAGPGPRLDRAPVRFGQRPAHGVQRGGSMGNGSIGRGERSPGEPRGVTGGPDLQRPRPAAGTGAGSS